MVEFDFESRDWCNEESCVSADCSWGADADDCDIRVMAVR